MKFGFKMSLKIQIVWYQTLTVFKQTKIKQKEKKFGGEIMKTGTREKHDSQKEIHKLRDIAYKMYSETDAQVVEAWKDKNGKLWDIAVLDQEGRLIAGLNVNHGRKN
jgi:hypothetical protein